MDIVLATRNQKKVHEFNDLLRPHGIDFRCVADFANAPEVQETGTSFEENACLKARQTAAAIGKWTLSDDSGLVVKALGGAPGVFSARFAGNNATDADNRAKLLQQMVETPCKERSAKFVCVLALSDPDGTVRKTARGECAGEILTEERGGGGFGYDALFYVPQFRLTFAELPSNQKSQISHRARAVANLVATLADLS